MLSEGPVEVPTTRLEVPGGAEFSLEVPYPIDGRTTELSIPWPRSPSSHIPQSVRKPEFRVENFEAVSDLNSVCRGVSGPHVPC